MAIRTQTTEAASLEGMGIDELRAYKAEVDRVLASKTEERRSELLRELAELGGVPKEAAPTKRLAADAGDTRTRPKPGVKYKDDKGNEWSGRGANPRWLQAYLAEGRSKEEFLVKAN